MNQLSDRLNSLSPSATLAMSQKSNELKAQGIDVINLSVGEPDFNTPDHIKEAAKKAIDDNFSRYSPVPGYPALRNAIVEKLKKENGLEYTAAQISCANGAKHKVIAVGFDSGALQIDAIKTGAFYGSVTQDPVSIGYNAVKLAVEAAKGNAVSDVDTGCQWYNAENIEEPDIAACLYE